VLYHVCDRKPTRQTPGKGPSSHSGYKTDNNEICTRATIPTILDLATHSGQYAPKKMTGGMNPADQKESEQGLELLGGSIPSPRKGSRRRNKAAKSGAKLKVDEHDGTRRTPEARQYPYESIRLVAAHL